MTDPEYQLLYSLLAFAGACMITVIAHYLKR
jgi:hypothetical protein